MATKMEPDQWQCGKSLPECLGYMFENQIACDVTFLVGEKKVEIKAHKAILIARSPVFFAMLNGPLQEANFITVPDIEDDVFKEVLRYVYTDKMTMTEETAIQVLYAAKKYCIDSLSQQCVDFLTASMTEDNVFILYEQAHLYEDKNLEEKCWQKMKENSEKCLKSPSFLDLCHSCCEKIVSSDDICVAEEIIYERVIKWSEAECTRKQLEISDVNRKNVLGSIFYKIRFPLIEKDYFAQNLLKSNLLSSDEKVAVMSFYLEVSDNSTCIFGINGRGIKKGKYDKKVIRYNNIATGWEYTTKNKDGINFMVSEKVYLHGIVLYGDEKGSEYSVDLKISDERGSAVASIKTKYTANAPGYMSDILLQTPVLIDRNKNYNVEALISGPTSFYGTSGMSSVIVNGITITFSKDKQRNNGTQTKHEDIEAQVLSTLNHHKNRVNCVTWIKSYGKEFPPGFVSGSVDCNVVVWKSDGNGKYKPSSTLKSHTGSVNAVTAIQTSFGNSQSDQIYVASSSADSTVNIWKKTGDDEFVLIQTLKFGTGFILDLVATIIPNTNVTLLACGCDDHKIHLYVEQDNQFVKVMSLSGHEDWIRAVDFTTDDDGDILLASAAQDNFIRIWRLSRKTEGVDLIKPIKELSLEEEIKIKGNTFKFYYNEEVVVFAVSLESVLHGHENWIYSIKWQPKLKTDTGYHQPMCLLSASMDKTMILWKPDPESGVWVEDVRVGEVGGNTLGLYGGMFSPDGTSIMAHGYQGAFHQWTFCQKTNSWRPVVTVGGHFDEVQDLDWDKGSGQFVISVSTDQTSRLHAPWVKDKRKTLWYEIARPQVHGYDMQCLSIINRYKFASGADEKVIRTFEAPKNFISNFCEICGLNFEEEMKKEEAQNRPEGASVPALGLSNKAVSSGQAVTKTSDIEQHPNDQYPEVYFTAVTLKEPPTEEHLLQNTLWPETQKLYGHGYEIFSLATDPTGQILASSCKAAKTDFAGVILWDISSWRQIETLQGHTLTVTQMSFSHNGRYLLTVSRDRTWCLYKKNTTESSSNSDKSFRRIAHTEKQGSVHSRIIWSCCWSHDDKFFFTASRDKKVMVWQKDEFEKEQAGTPPKPVSILEVSDSATAIDVAPLFVKDNRYLVSVGLENGSILLYTYLHGDKKDNSCWQQLSESSKQCYHSKTVKRLRFRPVVGLQGLSANTQKNNILQLASCSSDHSLRIFNVDLTKL